MGGSAARLLTKTEGTLPALGARSPPSDGVMAGGHGRGSRPRSRPGSPQRAWTVDAAGSSRLDFVVSVLRSALQVGCLRGSSRPRAPPCGGRRTSGRGCSGGDKDTFPADKLHSTQICVFRGPALPLPETAQAKVRGRKSSPGWAGGRTGPPPPGGHEGFSPGAAGTGGDRPSGPPRAAGAGPEPAARGRTAVLVTGGSRTLGAVMAGSPLLGHLGGHLACGSPIFSSGESAPSPGGSTRPVNPSGEPLGPKVLEGVGPAARPCPPPVLPRQPAPARPWSPSLEPGPDLQQPQPGLRAPAAQVSSGSSVLPGDRP